MADVDTVGIDLGTTNSAIAHWSPATGVARVLPNAEADRVTRSVVYFDAETGAAHVGVPALERLLDSPEAVVYSLKRFMGRTGQDRGVEEDRQHVTYDVEETDRHRLVVHVGHRLLPPPQVASHVLRKLARDAEATLGEPVRRAVITVPAYFEEPQRLATHEAGRLAGLEVRRIINEPTAAALAFGLGVAPQTVIVYDLGGGTFDVSVLKIDHGLFRVRATDGDTHLGGDDVDRAIVGWMRDEFARAHGIELPAADRALAARLRESATEAKVALSDATSHAIALPDLLRHEDGSLGLEATLTRERFEALLAPILERTLGICERVLAAARIDASAIDQALMVGGQTRTPAIRAALHERFGWKVNADVDPDEAVAQGAALLGARLCGHLSDRFRLMDVTPLSLGIELASGRFEPIVAANRQIPVKVERRQGFTTDRDGQQRIEFVVYQGERPIARDNTKVGDVVLDLGTARPRGVPRVDCIFHIDDDGILHVRAEESDTDQPAVEVSFDREYQITSQEIEAQRAAADLYRDDDALTRRLLDLRDALERAIASAPPASDARIAEIEAALEERDADRAEELLAALR